MSSLPKRNANTGCNTVTMVRQIMGRMVLATMMLGSVAMLQSAMAQTAASSAQLRIVTTPEGADVSFDGVDKGISPLHIRATTPGTHLIVVEMKNHVTHRETLDIAPGEKRTVDVDLDPITGLFLVHSEPTGVEVTVDGAARGKTPLLITDLPIGYYRVGFSKPGFIAKEINLSVTDRIPRKVDVSLTSDFAALVIDSTPEGATVTLNGANRGVTPLTIERIPTGDSELSVAAQGYHAYKESVKLSAGDRQHIVATLTPVPAKLRLVSIPAGARIYVNNQFRGEAPVELADLTPAAYRVRAEMPAYDPMLRTVTLKRGADSVEEFRLRRNCGIVEVTTEPAGVHVFIDGKKRGTSQAKPDETDKVSDILSIDLVSVGDHEMAFTKKGYYVSEETVTVERDQTVAKHIALKRRFIPNYEIRTATEIYTGVYIETNPQQGVKLELRPGIFKTIPRAEIRSGRPLRRDEAPPAVNR